MKKKLPGTVDPRASRRWFRVRRDAQIVKALADGFGATVVAAYFDLSRSRVYQIRAKLRAGKSVTPGPP